MTARCCHSQPASPPPSEECLLSPDCWGSWKPSLFTLACLEASPPKENTLKTLSLASLFHGSSQPLFGLSSSSGLHSSLLVWATREGGGLCLSPSGEGWEAAGSFPVTSPCFSPLFPSWRLPRSLTDFHTESLTQAKRVAPKGG